MGGRLLKGMGVPHIARCKLQKGGGGDFGVDHLSYLG